MPVFLMSGANLCDGIWHITHGFIFIFPVPLPKELENFMPIVGEKTQGSFFRRRFAFSYKRQRYSIGYDMAHALSEVLEPVAISTEEVPWFRYQDARSILGFVDGLKILMSRNGHIWIGWE